MKAEISAGLIGYLARMDRMQTLLLREKHLYLTQLKDKFEKFLNNILAHFILKRFESLRFER